MAKQKPSVLVEIAKDTREIIVRTGQPTQVAIIDRNNLDEDSPQYIEKCFGGPARLVAYDDVDSSDKSFHANFGAVILAAVEEADASGDVSSLTSEGEVIEEIPESVEA